MRNMLVLLIFLFIFQLSCAEITNITPITVNNRSADNFPITNPTSEQVVDKLSAKLDESDKVVIDTAVLSRIIRDNEYDSILGGLAPSAWLVYRAETITPFGIEQIENNPDIPKSLLDNFKAANQKTERLEDDYDALAPIQIFSGNRDLAKFYEKARRKYPNTRAVVNFSNIGIDNSYSQALVYVEYYSLDRGLIKFYFQMELEKLEIDFDGGKLSGVKFYKILQVY